jgi:small subunit ribosomal protein S2
VVDTVRETNALREAKVLGIPTIGLIDTDGDPEMVDIPIPGNDDSMRSIDVVVRTLSDAVKAGLQLRGGGEQSQDTPQPDDDRNSSRRSNRSQFSAGSEAAPAQSNTDAAGALPTEQVAKQS